ncbi:amidohydrolase family protein [Brachybacterium alimentarium]|uniref:amidohydrolase family protein n=1 Tax=Brachybacterium alimentarium TaxID=47845 RepID=UPI003FCFE325
MVADSGGHVPLGVADSGRTDAHLHLWDIERSPYAWMRRAPHLRAAARWEDVRDDLAHLGVDRVVLVQADDTTEDTVHLLQCAERIEAEGTRADVVAWMPLADPHRVEAQLADAQWRAGVVGVRHLIHEDPDPGFLERDAVGDSLDLIAAAGLSLDVPDAFDRHLEQTARVARDHSRLTIVLDHLGKPPFGDDPAMHRWQRQLRALADVPTVHAKVSGLIGSGGEDLEPVLDLAFDVFGSSRLMFGSDWPIAPRPFDLSTGGGALCARLAEESPSVRSDVFSGTAARVYRRIG